MFPNYRVPFGLLLRGSLSGSGDPYPEAVSPEPAIPCLTPNSGYLPHQCQKIPLGLHLGEKSAVFAAVFNLLCG